MRLLGQLVSFFFCVAAIPIIIAGIKLKLYAMLVAGLGLLLLNVVAFVWSVLSEEQKIDR